MLEEARGMLFATFALSWLASIWVKGYRLQLIITGALAFIFLLAITKY